MTIPFEATRSYVYKAARYELLPRIVEIVRDYGDEPFLLREIVIAHPTPAIGPAGSLAASTKRMVSNTEARLAFAVLTTERKAA